MNFLIFDNELLSVHLIKSLVDDSHHVTLLTTNTSSTTLPAPSSFLKVKSGDIINATQVLEILSKHEHDPFDAVLIFNLPLHTGLTNIAEAIQRLKNEIPPVFLFYVNRLFESNRTMDKTFKESAHFLQWTVINSPAVNASSETTLRIENTANPAHRNPISSTAVAEFLKTELKKKEYRHKIIYLY